MADADNMVERVARAIYEVGADRYTKARMLGDLFDQIEVARTKANRARRDADAAEVRVDNLLATARRLMHTD